MFKVCVTYFETTFDSAKSTISQLFSRTKSIGLTCRNPSTFDVCSDMVSTGSSKESRHSRVLMPVLLSACAIPISMLFWIVNVTYSILWPDTANPAEGFVSRFQIRSRIIALKVKTGKLYIYIYIYILIHVTLWTIP